MEIVLTNTCSTEKFVGKLNKPRPIRTFDLIGFGVDFLPRNPYTITTMKHKKTTLVIETINDQSVGRYYQCRTRTGKKHITTGPTKGETLLDWMKQYGSRYGSIVINDTTEWFQYGRFHRDGTPAVEDVSNVK